MSRTLACPRFGSTLAVLASLTLTGVAHSQTTNSWIDPSDGKWERKHNWEDGQPSLAQSAVLISNANSKAVTIDTHTARNFPDSLTISNLNISAPSGTTNTLWLNNTGTVALHVLNTLNISLNFNEYGDLMSGEGGALIASNSTLIVDGSLENNGTLIVTGGKLITTNGSLQVTPFGDVSSAPGLLLISNAVVQARDVGVYGGVYWGIVSNGTLDVFGGTMTLSSTLTIGFGEDSGQEGSVLVANGGKLVINNAETDIAAGIMTVENSVFLGDDVSVDGYFSAGALVINNGTVIIGGVLGIGYTSRQYGSVDLNGGLLVVTNNSIYIGGWPGSGDLNVSNGLFLGQAIYLSEGGGFSMQGGTSILDANLEVYLGGNVDISGGELIVTNGSIRMYNGYANGYPQCIVSGGSLVANSIEIHEGQEQFFINGGSVTVSTGITLGDCNDLYDTGDTTTVDGGQLIVTNASHTAFIDVQNGSLVLNNGFLQVDALVMTNPCSAFIHTGGTLIVGSVILDPNTFRIVSVTPQGNDMLVTWMMGPGATNTLQATAGGTRGSYTTNGFADIFVVTNNPTTGCITNYLDVGAATNVPSRYYRARFSP